MTDLVVVSLERWDEVWRRNQHLVAGLLARDPGLRVLFVEPPADPTHDLRSRRRPRLGRAVSPIDGIAPGRLWRVQPVKWLPRRFDRGADGRLVRQIMRAAAGLGLHRPLLWINDPGLAELAVRSGWPAVYDITDDWLAADRPRSELDRVAANEARLFAVAREVVVCSPELVRRKSPERPVVLIPNAVDAAAYRRPAPRPADLPDGPVALYLGTVHPDRIDTALCEAAAKALADRGTLVLVGPNLLPADDAARLERAGARLLGPRSREQVIGYLQHADVLVVPHVVTAFTDSLDPIKLYEYQAVGRPVVSTPVAGFRDAVDPRITVADGDGFVRAVVAAVPATSRFPDGADGPVTDWGERVAAMGAVLDGMADGSSASMASASGVRRVALVASSYHPHFGGVEEHVQRVARELAARDDTEVEVWTVDRGDHLGTRELDGIRVRDLPAPLPARRLRSLAALVRDAPRAWRAWNAAVREFRPDLLHVHCFGPNGVYALALSRRRRVPLAVTSHGETFMDDHGAFARSALLRGSLRRALRRAVFTTAPSEFVLRDLREHSGLVGGSVVPNGVAPAPGAPAPGGELRSDAPAAPYFAAVGRLGRPKGFDLLVEAFAAAALPPEVRLLIGGDGPERPVLERRIAELGLTDRAVLLGRLDAGAVHSLMASSLATVVPSRVEAFGIVVLEAWRAGAPLVVTDHGGPPEFVHDGVDGLLVDPTDTAALAASLRRVHADPALRAQLAAAGRTRVPEFGWAGVAEAYRARYDAVSRAISRR